jgi:tRNA (Thr-GGU) A37 N-methylase
MSDETTTLPGATYHLHPIGTVRHAEDGVHLTIDAPYRAGLAQLDQFSHAIVFWWANALDTPGDRARLVTDLPYAPGVEAGVFACRSPYRPNPIAVTVCPMFGLDERSGDILTPWIDAADGTPILDLKPYIPMSDRVREVEVAPWLRGWPDYAEDAATFDFSAVGLDE